LRAASASAFTLPWYRNPARSNTTALTPAAFAFSAIDAPTAAAAETFPVFADSAPASALSRVDAAASVLPARSSITCAYMWLSDL
jgi:hypothetical protein